jgi:hypothetical protein
MAERPAIPPTFLSNKTGERHSVPLTVRDTLDIDAARAVVSAVGSIRWSESWHAYGPADDVGGQLIAAALGDEQTRKTAWWELFGNINHQGTIYEATVPAVPIIAELALWRDYPDRVEALAFLAAIAQGEGVVVWRYDDDDHIVHNEERQATLGNQLSAEMVELSAVLLSAWKHEPDEVKRALLMVLAHLPALQEDYSEMVDELLPNRFKEAWLAIQAGPDSQEMFDEVDAFERWAYGDDT